MPTRSTTLVGSSRKGATGKADKTPLVTVVVSFRERWRFTAQTVESILRNTDGDFAVWVLDSGMPEDVRAALKPDVDADKANQLRRASALCRASRPRRHTARVQKGEDTPARRLRARPQGKRSIPDHAAAAAAAAAAPTDRPISPRMATARD